MDLPFSLNPPSPIALALAPLLGHPPSLLLSSPLLSSSPPSFCSLTLSLQRPRRLPSLNNVQDRRDRPPIRPQAIPLCLASHILSSSCSTYYRPHLYRLPTRRCHHRRPGQGRRCKEHPSSKLSSRGACRHRWRVSTSFLGRACKCPNDQCSPRNHGRCTHRVDSQVSATFTVLL